MCDFPTLAHDLGIDPDTGKRRIRLLGRPDLSFEAAQEKYGDHLLKLPCGKCPSCLRNYSKTWSVRCMLESLYHPMSVFVTLTFDDGHLPGSLDECRRLFQLFLKRLRKHFNGYDIRYFGCCERGGVTRRLHGHFILFGCDFDDKKPVFVNQLKNQFYTSDTLSKLWTKGFANFSDVTADSCAYVARYSMKKKLDFGDDDYFLMMSTRPAIGQRWFYDKRKLIYLSDRIYSKDFHGVSVPRYFDKLAENDPVVAEMYAKIKEDRVNRAKSVFQSRVILSGKKCVEEMNIENIKRGLQGISRLKKRSL